MDWKIGQVGCGFVGSALKQSFEKRGVSTIAYDKYKEIGSPEDLLNCNFIFLCLPTPYVAGHGYDLGAILDTCKFLNKNNFTGTVIVKSTVEPGVTQKLANQFSNIDFIHNPEFLTARTAFEDFDNQQHIVLGYTLNKGDICLQNVEKLKEFYSLLYPGAKISICKSEESEAMKIFANNFYAMKVQIFNEFYFLCQRIGADFERVKELMIENGWINPMHTQVPGPDGLPSYGGACFPKDTNALYHFMKTLGTPYKVLEACIEERNEMREEKWK